MSSEKTVVDWLNGQCSRLLYGKCTTLRCLRRGGYTGPEDYDTAVARATCEPYEAFLAIARVERLEQALREVIKVADRETIEFVNARAALNDEEVGNA